MLEKGNIDMKWVNPLMTNVPHHMETNQLICGWFIYDEDYWSLMG